MRTIKLWLATIAMLLCSIMANAQDFEVDGIYYNIHSAADRTVEVASNGGTFGDIVIPSIVKFNNIDFTVTRIGSNAFVNGADIEYQITSVSLPNTIVSIGRYAFENCFSLEEINIPEGVTTIEEGAFRYSSCGNVSLPNSLMSIGAYAFEYSGMTYCKLPHSIQLGVNALYSAKIVSLEPFGYINGGMSGGGISSFNDEAIFILPYEEVYVDELGYSVTSEMDYLSGGLSYGQIRFYDKTSFTDAEIQTVLETGGRVKQNGIEYRISSLRNTFTLEVYAADNGIITADIPSKINYLNREFSVTSIRESVFANNTALTTVKIPNSIQSIGSNAFAGCTSISKFTTESATPLTINEGCFDAMTQLFATLYVPAGAVSAYKSADVWKGFGVITEAGVSYKTITMKANAGGTITCGSTAVSNGTEYINTSNSSEEIILTPKAYHTLAKVLVDGTDVTSQVNNGVLTINVTADTEIEAIFNSQSEILLQDEQASFELESDISCDKITYTRTLPNLDWNSLFVPFEVSVDDLTDKYDVAYINDIHSYDRDRNGTIDEMEMEVIYLTNGTLNANHPYLIRAKNEADKELTIIVNDAILYSSDNRTDISCSSVYTDFEVIGTYEKMTAQELDGCYAINTSGAWSPIASGASLNPFRLYMTITSRNGSPVKVSQSAMSRINIRVQGEDTETGIGEIVKEDAKAEIYDMTGRRLQNAHKGIYIINGKKVIK